MPAEVQKKVLDTFRKLGASTLDRRVLLESIDDFSNADIIRAIEALETGGKVVRFTDRGSAWVALSKGRKKNVRTRGTAEKAPELIYERPHPIGRYEVIVLGVERTDGTWAGWLQFRDPKTNRKLRTGQETSQPNRKTLEYWATGLEDLYLQGALERAGRS